MLKNLFVGISDKKVKWLVYTVLVGCIPILLRLMVRLIIGKEEISFFASSDFIALGLVLHVSNMNEIEHISVTDMAWKTAQNGVSFLFISVYGVLFALSLLDYMPTLIDKALVTRWAGILALISLMLSYSVFDRISKNTVTP